MKKIIFLTLIFVSIITYSAKPAHSIGIGLFFEGGGGGTFYFLPYGYSDRSSGQGFLGGGIMFDTAVSTNTLFNYRVAVAYNWTRATAYTPPEYYLINKVIPLGNLDLNQIKMINTFGFGLVRTDKMRFWIGQQLNILYTWGDNKITGTYSGHTINRTDTISITGVGIGFVLGINFHLTGIVSLEVEAGARLNVSGGSTYGTYSYDGSTPARKEIAVVNLTPEGFATVGVLFRINEKFTK